MIAGMAADFEHILQDTGDEIVYQKKNGDRFEMQAIVVKNASPPTVPAGYNNNMSNRWHEFTFVAALVPERGDTVTLNGTTYTVDHVYPQDDYYLRVLAR